MTTRLPILGRVMLFVVSCIMVLVGFTVQGNVTSAHADTGSPSFSIRPTYTDPNNPYSQYAFYLSGKPGMTIRSSVHVENDGTAKGIGQLFPSDATTGDQGFSVKYLVDKKVPTDVGAWVKGVTRNVTLDVAQSRDIAFSVNIPKNAKSGQHLAGLVISTYTNDGSINLNGQGSYLNRLIIPIVILLPGTRVYSFTLGTQQVVKTKNVWSLQIPMQNVGNMTLHPSLLVKITDSHKKTVLTKSDDYIIILPGDRITYLIGLSSLKTGSYTVATTLHYGVNNSKVVSNTRVFSLK